MVSMKLRYPNVTASIWSSGKITVTGATSDEEARKGARRVARILQNLGFKVKFSHYRVVNVLGTVSLPFGIKISQFTEHNRNICRSVYIYLFCYYCYALLLIEILCFLLSFLVFAFLLFDIYTYFSN